MRKLSLITAGVLALGLASGTSGTSSTATADDESTIYEGQTLTREFTQHEDTPNRRVTTNITVTESVRADTSLYRALAEASSKGSP